MVQFTTATSPEDLHQILDLQAINLPHQISEKELSKQGFVTVKHNFELLESMNKPFPHIVAKFENKVVGYALVMQKSFRHQIPVLFSMFEKIDGLTFKNRALKTATYFVMGQVCIAKAFRGQGLFDGLFKKMKEEMSDDFDLIVTEVATRNIRSMRAHFRVGFETLLEYKSPEGEEWGLIAWDWR